MTDEHDDLTGIFDDLSPEDFVIRLKRGDIEFTKFVKDNINSIRVAYAASEGRINPIAVFAAPENEWMFTPNDDENMGQYITRLREAAKTLKATWFFISRVSMVGTYETDADDVPDFNDRDAIKQAREAGLLSQGILYYAERYEDGVRDCRHGFMREEDGKLGELVEGNPFQSTGLFSNILS